MFVFISIPFTKSIFDIIDTNPEDSDIIMSEKEYALAYNEYEKKFNNQMRIEVQTWIDNNLKRESIVTWLQDSGSESIEFEVQID